MKKFFLFGTVLLIASTCVAQESGLKHLKLPDDGLEEEQLSGKENRLNELLKAQSEGLKNSEQECTYTFEGKIYRGLCLERGGEGECIRCGGRMVAPASQGAQDVSE